jgi:hypothetical protein
MLLVVLGTDSISAGRFTPGTHRSSTGLDIRRVRRPCERCPRNLPQDLVHQYPFVFASEDLSRRLREGRAAPKVASALNVIHEPLVTYSDAYEATHHVVESFLSIQHVLVHITCDLEAAPFSELDQVKCRIISISPAPAMQTDERLLDDTMPD